MTFVRIEGNNVTENPYRKSVTPVPTESNNVTENPYRKSVKPVTTESNNVTENPYSKFVTPLTTMKLKFANEIKQNDSAFTSMSCPIQQVVCELLRDGPPKRGDKMLLKFMNCAYQNNSDDCGLNAIRNAVAEAFGIDPTTQEYDTALNKMKCNFFLLDH